MSYATTDPEPLRRPPLRIEVDGRVEEARAMAGRYAELGWPVTPSCNGINRHGVQCPSAAVQELHTASARWWSEATTRRKELDGLWASRPAYGVIGALRGVADVLDVRSLPWSECVAHLAAADVEAPVLRTALLASSGFGISGERLRVLVAASRHPAGELSPGVTLMERYRPVPLPSTANSYTGQVRWAAFPDPPTLPTANAVLAALHT